jgi:AcrR family transcriptional regulator
MVIKDFPLRERKQSKTRLAIYDACINALKTKHLADIKVEEICDEVEISRGTFFTYFPRKQDVIYYAIRLWSIKIGWVASHTPQKELGLAFIEYIFKKLATDIKKSPMLWVEITALRAFEPKTMHRLNQNKISMVTKADKVIRFPDKPGIEDIPEGTTVTYFRKNLRIAMEKKELPATLDIDSVLISLNSIVWGAPMMMAGYTDFERLAEEYGWQLNIIWTGLKTILAGK